MTAPTAISVVDFEALAEEVQECGIYGDHGGKVVAFITQHECWEGFACEFHLKLVREYLKDVDSRIVSGETTDALRLAIQGTQLMNHGFIQLPMEAAHRDFLLAVRSGGFTKEQVTVLLDNEFIPTLKNAIEQSTLPDKPDYDVINDWLTETHLRWWQEKGLV